MSLTSTIKTDVNSERNHGDPYAKYHPGFGKFCPIEYQVPYPTKLHYHNEAATSYPRWGRYIDSLNSIGESVLLNW